MSFDEALFGWVSDRVRTWRGRPDPERLRRRALAEPLLPRLRVIASAVAGDAVDLAIAPDGGGAGGGVILLPAEIARADTPEANERLYLLRAAFAGVVVRRGLVADEDGEAEMRAAAPDLEAALADELPGWAEARATLEGDAVELWGRLLTRPEARSFPGPLEPRGGAPGRGATERRSRPRNPPRRAVLDTHEEQENPFTHSFEKVHTAEDYQGGSKRADGADELDAHHAALEELDLEQVVLSAAPTQSVYQADALFLGAAGEEGSGDAPGLRYDEWDGVRRRYLARYCRLTVETPPVSLSAGAALRARVAHEQRRAVEHVRREMLRLETAMRWRTRQPDGPEVDIDSVVEREASIRAGHEGPDRLYVSRRRRGHELAALVLLDASMSTDGWVCDRRVLDTERDAAVVMSVALDGWVDELGLAAFMSYSHDDCRFIALKGFGEDWSRGYARLAALEPGGYTRVGPALRHGTELLGRCAAKRKLLLLLTDGKPTDTDRYEGRHGERDVRQAIREARRVGVDVFAFAVDPRARKQLPAMFGDKNFAGLESPEKLASAAAALCARLRA